MMYYSSSCIVFPGTWKLEHGTEIRRISMPFVNIKITKDGATAEQKEALIKGTTDLLVKVLNKNPATTVVVIDEVDTDNWGIGGETVSNRRNSP
jgi:4-oxalocrotonate tautomerase